MLLQYIQERAKLLASTGFWRSTVLVQHKNNMKETRRVRLKVRFDEPHFPQGNVNLLMKEIMHAVFSINLFMLILANK